MTITIGNGLITGINRGYPGTPARGRTRSGLLDDGVIAQSDISTSLWYQQITGGYTRLGSGLIIQYGYDPFSFANGDNSVSFYMTFPNAVLQINIHWREWWNRNVSTLRVISYSTSGFTFRCTNAGTTTTEVAGWELDSTLMSAQWMAVGY